MPGRIVVCGNLVQDILVRGVADPVLWGTTATVEGIEQHLGGNGGSTSYTLGKLGIPVTLVSLAGQDAAGDRLIGKLNGAGVETHVDQGKFATSVSVSLVDRQGRRALLYQLGASAGEFPPWQLPPDITHLHLNATYRMDFLRREAGALLAQAAAAGISTSLDAQWDHRNEWPPIPPTNLLFVNETEAEKLTGLRDHAAAALALRDYGAGEVVIKLGEHGCFASTSEGDFYTPAHAVNAVDTTGAGDCFCGAYLASLYWGKSHREAARYANRIAALSVTALGATTALDSELQLSSL